MSAPVSNLGVLLRTMRPERRPGRFVFAAWPDERSAPDAATGTFREAEGLSVLLPEAAALAAGVEPSAPLAHIALTVHSDLEAVGLTAAVAGALARAGIACNVVAAVRHDHLFVPESRVDEALDVLEALSREAR